MRYEFEAYKCPECGTIQLVADDQSNCLGCDYGGEEEGWESVTAVDDDERGIVEVE